MRRRTVIGATSVLAVAAGAAGVTTIAVGSSDPEVTVPVGVAAQYPALASPQGGQDIVRAGSADNAPAAKQISKTSRLVASSAAGKLYAFVSEEGKPCLLLQNTAAGVGASGCADSEQSDPGIVAFSQQPPGSATVANLVREGVTSVTVERPGQPSEQVDTKDGGFTYTGKIPFKVTWADSRGSQTVDASSAPNFFGKGQPGSAGN